MSSLEGELDRNRMHRVLSGALVEEYAIGKAIAGVPASRSDR
jgi:hypothetical protein